MLEALSWCDGVMLGREAYHRPWLLVELRAALEADQGSGAPDRAALLARMADYAARELARGERLPSITRHLLGLYAGEPGGREFRRRLSEGARDPQAGADCCSGSPPAVPGKVAITPQLRIIPDIGAPALCQLWHGSASK